jgi:hypothetical protein
VKSLFATVASFGFDRGEWELAGAFLVGCGSLALAGVTVFFTQ